MSLPGRIAILVAVVGLTAVRLWLRRRRPSGRRLPPRFDARAAWGSWIRSDTGLVAAREIRERVRTRAFRVVTAIILLVVAAAIVVPEAVKSSPRPQRIGVVGTLSAGQSRALAAAARDAGTQVQETTEPDADRAASAVRSGRLDLALVASGRLIVRKQPAATDTSTTARLTRTLATRLGLEEAFSAAHLSAGQVSTITSARPLPITSLEAVSSRSAQDRGTSVIGIILVFVMLTQYETWTLIGVMEEKSSRVVEVLLATVKPIQLLGGKVLGIGIVALAQAGAVLAFAVALGEAVGSPLLDGAAPQMLVAALVWLVVGYAFYCWVYAAAGSMAERQDQVQTMAIPLSVPMIVGYILGLTAASSGHASPFVEVLAYVPPTAPFTMPVLVGLGAVSWWGFAASVAISVAATAGVARLAAAVYRRAVLRTGHRVRLREVMGG